MTTASSSLPNLEMESVSTRTQLFNRQENSQIPYKASEVDSVVGYFLKRGFERVAAINTALILLQNAGQDKIPVHELLDTLKGIDDVQLSQIVAKILNSNRSASSQIGYKFENKVERFDERNIVVGNQKDQIILQDEDYTRYGYVKEGYVE
jgi:hypothetical protein